MVAGGFAKVARDGRGRALRNGNEFVGIRQIGIGIRRAACQCGTGEWPESRWAQLDRFGILDVQPCGGAGGDGVWIYRCENHQA